jgi:putative tryptophan/tyrosine transport system substrate-binding protein
VILKGVAMTSRRLLLINGLAILAVPLFVIAEQAPRPRRIVYLGPGSAKSFGTFLDAFRQGLRDNGLHEGRDYVLDILWADGRYERFPALVDEALQLKPSVLVPGTIAAVRAAMQATTSIPIVMASINDPVGAGLIESLARPGANVTGVATLASDVTPKLVDMLREIDPRVKQAAMILNPRNPSNRLHLEAAQVAGRAVGMTIEAFEMSEPSQLNSTFMAIVGSGKKAILLARDAMLLDSRAEMSALALRNRIPLVAPQPDYADAGALIGYGTPTRENYRRAAVYVKKVLAGAKPADLPVEQPTSLSLFVNLRTAHTLALAIPQSILLRADHLIK